MHIVSRLYYDDYMDSFNRFEDTALPSQGSFFSKLSGSPCSDSEYTYATRVWNTFWCETIADYHGIYLQLDVLQLFREISQDLFRFLHA